MAWREIEIAGERWHVGMAAERRANSETWTLVLSFRAPDAVPRRAFWHPWPLSASSRSVLFRHAEQIGDEALKDVVRARLAPTG
ncbi:MAG: hypothetical protein NW201_06245 [Gemmatimonadales bacterium]|nr:hypothetical protein [Gemmatimonadales bacterium]